MNIYISEEPLGDKVFDIIVVTLGIIWLAGWVFLLVTMLIQKLFPRTESKLERFLQGASKPLGFVQKYLLIVAILLLLVKLLARWFGWIPQ